MILRQASKPNILLEIFELVAGKHPLPMRPVMILHQASKPNFLLEIFERVAGQHPLPMRLVMIPHQAAKPNFLFAILEKVAVDMHISTVYPFLQSQGIRTQGYCQCSVDASAADCESPRKGRKL